MRLGLIVESGPQGAEAQVLPYLAKKIIPGIVVETPVTFQNKPDMIANCGVVLTNLINNGCDKVLIVWDLYPAWRDDGCQPDCVEDCRSIRESLHSVGVTKGDTRVVLICICEELEAWLLADGRALSAVLSRSTYKVQVRDIKKPDRVRKPKAQLRKLFKQSGRNDYSDRTHAIKIVQAMPDHTRILRSQSFQRFTSELQA